MEMVTVNAINVVDYDKSEINKKKLAINIQNINFFQADTIVFNRKNYDILLVYMCGLDEPIAIMKEDCAPLCNAIGFRVKCFE